MAIEEARLFCGDFFGGVSGAHADYGIFVPEASDEFAKTARMEENEARYFVGAADGTAIRAFEHCVDFLTRHL